MSDLEAVKRAIWEAERDHQRDVASVQMMPLTEMRLSLSVGSKWEMAILEPGKHTIFGIPILLDPSMRPDEIKLIADCGCTVKLINLG